MAPPIYAAASPGADGRIVLVNTAPLTAYRVAGADVELSSEREEVCEFAAGDPLSSVWRERARSTWRREAWNCAVEVSYRLTADASGYQLQETLRALEDGQEVFSRSADTRIERDLM